jgi:hypothetical protein
MKTILCLIAGLFVTFIHGFTVPSYSRRGGNWILQTRQLETNLFAKKKKKGANADKGFAAVKEQELSPTPSATQKAEATARGLLAARFEMETKQRAKNNAAPEAAEMTLESEKVVEAAPPAPTDPQKAEATARALLATRLDMEDKQRAKNKAATATAAAEIALEQEKADKAEASAKAALEIEREAVVKAALETAKANAKNAEATARALLATRFEMEAKVRAATPKVEAEAQEETEPVAEAEEPEPEPEPVVSPEAVTEPEPEPEKTKAEVETVAEPEPEQAEPEAKETAEPRAGALVAINKESIEFTSGLIGGAIGFTIGGPVLAAIVASVANYFSRKQVESYTNVIQSIAKTTIAAFNAVAGIEAKLQILEKSKKALEGTLESLKKSDGVDPESIKQVEDTLEKVTAKLAELNEELDPVGAGFVVLKAIGDLIEKVFDAAGEVNKEYELTDRATASIKEAVDKTKSGLN